MSIKNCQGVTVQRRPVVGKGIWFPETSQYEVIELLDDGETLVRCSLRTRGGLCKMADRAAEKANVQRGSCKFGIA